MKKEHKHTDKPCLACEEMYLDRIKKLEKQVELLIEMIKLERLAKPIVFQVPDSAKSMFDSVEKEQNEK